MCNKDYTRVFTQLLVQPLSQWSSRLKMYNHHLKTSLVSWLSFSVTLVIFLLIYFHSTDVCIVTALLFAYLARRNVYITE